MDEALKELGRQKAKAEDAKKYGLTAETRSRMAAEKQRDHLAERVKVLEEEKGVLDRDLNQLHLVHRNTQRTWSQEKHVLNITIDEAVAQAQTARAEADQRGEQVKRLQRLNTDVEKHERELSGSLENMLAQLRVSSLGSNLKSTTMDFVSKYFFAETHSHKPGAVAWPMARLDSSPSSPES